MSVESLTALFDQPTSLQITWLILHFLWQGVAIAAVVFLVNYVAAAYSAKFRYGVAVAGLMTMVVVVVATAASYRPSTPSTPTIDAPATTHASTTRGDDLANPKTTLDQVSTTAEPPSTLEVVAPTATTIYLLGVALMLLRIAVSAMGIGRLRLASSLAGQALARKTETLSRQVGLKVQPALRTCQRVVIPFVTGVLKPTIILPTSIASGMTHAELEAILLHELAHIRRCDLLVNFVQRITESLLFFHPAVWYVSRAITVERENCCDDIVLSHCNQKVYASALVRLAEACTQNPNDVAPVAALAATGANPSQLKRRVMRILGTSPVQQFNRSNVTALLLCGLAIAATAVHLQAQATDNSPTAPLTVSFNDTGNITDFTLSDSGKDAVTHFMKVMQQLNDNENVSIESMNITKLDRRTTMAVTGSNFDIATLQAAVRSSNQPKTLSDHNSETESKNELSLERKRQAATGETAEKPQNGFSRYIFETEFEIADLEASLNAVESSLASDLRSPPEALVESKVSSLPEIVALRRKIQAQELALQKIKSNAKKGDKSAIYISLKKDADALRQQLAETREARAKEIQESHLAAKVQAMSRQLTQKCILVNKLRQKQDELVQGSTDAYSLQTLKHQMRDEELESQYGPDHPERRSIRRQIERLTDGADGIAKLEESKASASPNSKSSTTTGPVRFKFFEDDGLVVLGNKADVDRVTRAIEKNMDSPPTSNGRARRAQGSSTPQKGAATNKKLAATKRSLTGPVRIEFIEGTDTYAVRGKKEDVVRVKKLLDSLSEAQQTNPKDTKELDGRKKQKPNDESSEQSMNSRLNDYQLAPNATSTSSVEAILSGIERLSDYMAPSASDDEAKLGDFEKHERQQENRATRSDALKNAKGKFANRRIFRLRNIDAEQTCELLRRMLANRKDDGIDVSADPSSNSIVVRAPSDVMKSIEDHLRQIDPPGSVSPTASIGSIDLEDLPNVRNGNYRDVWPFLNYRSPNIPRANDTFMHRGQEYFAPQIHRNKPGPPKPDPLRFPASVEKAMMMDAVDQNSR